MHYRITYFIMSIIITHLHTFTKSSPINFAQVHNSSIASNHQAHHYTFTHQALNIYQSCYSYAMRLDTTPICMWYQITFEAIAPDAN